jgi:hypothetical protein
MEGRLWDVQPDRYLGDATARQELDSFYQALAASDSVIHSIDVAGLAARAGVDEALETRVDQGRETLAQFALNTGGRFIKDISDLGAGLRQVLDATRYYYVLAFEPTDTGRKKEKLRKLEVYGYALDAEGRIRDVLALNPTLDLAKLGPSLRQRGLQVITSFAVPTGLADLRFLVRDSASGRAGSLRVRVTVPAFAGEGLVLSPPLFVDDPQTRVVLPTPSRVNPQMEIPFRLADTAFTPDGLPTLARGTPREICILAWRGTGEAAAGSLEVSAELVGPSGASPLALAGAPRLVRDADGFQRIAFTLAPPDAPAGSYALRVTVRDPRTTSEARSETMVQVN